jgi:hypothetical protein
VGLEDGDQIDAYLEQVSPVGSAALTLGSHFLTARRRNLQLEPECFFYFLSWDLDVAYC